MESAPEPVTVPASPRGGNSVFRPRPGVNCWRVERAERFALLVDAAEYYRRLHQVLPHARHSLFLVGWDFDSRVRLVTTDAGGPPAELGRLLEHAVRSRRGLRAHVLAWDFSTLFALERELGLVFRLGWRTHRRLRFRYDAKHPFGASQHQKIVAVDDSLAFTGGLDVTSRRWDTPAHRPDDERREDPGGASYRPFHDVQCVMTGPAARALAELARWRWRRVARCVAMTPSDAADERELWPDDLVPDLEHVQIAVARTFAAFGGSQAVREVEESLLESIRCARRHIYLENQYFTSVAVTEALAARLSEPHGPEVVMVLPRRLSGWLERRTMGPLAQRALHRLHAADRNARLRTVYPVASRARDADVFVHAKVGCFDDQVFRVGSANLSNRSMGLDSECDVLVLGGSEAERRGIARMRDRLLAEHLGATAARVADVLGETGSLARVIDVLGRGDRTLAPLSVPEHAPEEPVLTADWEEPMEPTVFLDTFLDELGRGRRRTWPRMAALVTAALAAAGVGAWISQDPAGGTAWTERPLVVVLMSLAGVLAIGATLLVPRMVLVLALVLAFGPLAGAALALAAFALLALGAFLVGCIGGQPLVQRVAGLAPLRIGTKLAGRGLVGLVLVRLVPVAPATVVDLACGAARLPLGWFLLGTVMGSLPGVAAFALLGARIAELVREPGPGTLALAAMVALAIVLAAVWLDAYVSDHDLRPQARPAAERR